MAGYVIDFQLRGLAQAVAQMKALASAASQAKAAVSGIGGVSALGSGGSGSGSSSGGSGGGGSSAAQMLNAQANMVKAQAQALRAQVAAMNSMRRQARQQHSGQNQLANALKKLVYSTRIGPGGGGGLSVMPLVGDLLKVVGMLGPEVEIAVLAIAAMAAEIVMLGKAATDFGVNFAQAGFIGGATPGETARLGGVAAAAGISSTQAAQMAQAFNQSLMNNPYAAARAAAGGYAANYAGPYGDQDDTRRFLKGFQDILSPNTTDKQAIAAARGGPLESLLWMRKADPAVREKAIRDATMNASPDMQRQAANIQIQLNSELAKTSQLMAQIGTQVLPLINTVLENFSHHLNMVQLALDEMQIGFYKFLQWIHDTFHVGDAPKRPDDAYSDLANKKARADAKQTDAMDRNSNATDDLTQNIRALNQHIQTFGGGPNARNALPANFFNPNNASVQSQISLGQVPI